MENINGKRNIQVFKGENYSIWKFRIRSLLSELDVIEVIDGPWPFLLPDNKWKRAEVTAKNVIIEHLSDTYLSFVKPQSSPKEILSVLDDIFERKSLAKQLNIRRKLLNLKLEGSIDLKTNFLQFDHLLSELATAGATLTEGDKIIELLLTLPDTYHDVIVTVDRLPLDEVTLGMVKTRLLEQEIKLRHEKLSTSQENNESTRNMFNNFRNVKKLEMEINKPKVNNKCNMKSKIKCHHCGRKGHGKKYCRYYLRYLKNNHTREIETRPQGLVPKMETKVCYEQIAKTLTQLPEEKFLELWGMINSQE